MKGGWEMELLVSKEEYQAVTLCINIIHTPNKKQFPPWQEP
jgi:hypothetical protein